MGGFFVYVARLLRYYPMLDKGLNFLENFLWKRALWHNLRTIIQCRQTAEKRCTFFLDLEDYGTIYVRYIEYKAQVKQFNIIHYGTHTYQFRFS